MGLREHCFAFYRQVQPVIAPGLKYSQVTYESVLTTLAGQGKTWLELGCGHQLLPPWRLEQEKQLSEHAKQLVGFDFDFEAIRKHRTLTERVCGDASKLPFRSNSFDLVSSNMVFEHLEDPQAQLAEIYRVLRPGGTLVFHTPNKFGYGAFAARIIPSQLKVMLAGLLQGRTADDVYPTFYRINSETDIRRVAAKVGFEITELQLILSSPILTMVPPLLILELLWLRLLMTPTMRPARTNIIGILLKPAN